MKTKTPKLLLAAAVLAMALPLTAVAAKGDIIIGQATVIDGDTIDIRGKRIRLHGIDAPERNQSCTDQSGQSIRCGVMVTRALDEHIARRNVACQVMDVDRWGRFVGRCDVPAARSGAITGTMNRALAQAGYVYAMPRYSRDYVGDVDRARAQRQGLFAGQFEEPAEFRRRARK